MQTQPVHFIVWATAGISAGVLALLTLSPSARASEPAAIDFEKHVEPIFLKRCTECHGPDERKSAYRLDDKATAFAGGDSGSPAIVPGEPDRSELFRRISTDDEDDRMPHKGDRLTAEETEVLRAWIEQGAAWPDRNPTRHWAFQRPVLPAAPDVSDEAWIRNEIDRFILAPLESSGIRPSPEADAITLLRRLSFDLLGLPPTPTEVDEFLGDSDPDAYERLVDRILESPHFGERWGRHWLDLARYADSDGYEKDRVRPYAYLYRDWVIRAINEDLPFDRFTIAQLAGDLLPDADLNRRIATGFHRNTLKNTEGGTDQEEDRCKIAKDRVDTTASVWLGLTVACAQCHSHKYDPITQKEYYGLYAFFNSVKDTEVPAPSSAELGAYEQARSAHTAKVERAEAAIAAYRAAGFKAALAKWEEDIPRDEGEWRTLLIDKATSKEGAELTVRADGVIEASGPNPAADVYDLTGRPPLESISLVKLEVLPDTDYTGGPGRTKHGNFVLNRFTLTKSAGNADAPPESIALTEAVASHAQENFPVAGAIDADDKTGWAIGDRYRRSHVAVFKLENALSIAPGESLSIGLTQTHGSQHTIARLRISVAAGGPFEADPTPPEILNTLKRQTADRTLEEEIQLAKYFASIDPEMTRLQAELDSLKDNEPSYPPTKAAIMTENDAPPVTRVHVRGDFLRQTDEVEPHTMKVLHRFEPKASRPNRLDLAHWLVDPANPLTARVQVNRVWRILFGRGLVRTADDFGLRGEPPSHPELLDWLALEFQRLGWSRKALIKTIVTSATYRQTSHHRPDLAEIDPQNVRLARQNRFRLEAETIRDNFLRIGGLLTPKIGGPSIRPPLPEDIAALGYADSVKWQSSEGEDQYRRGLYIFFQRTVPYPMLMTFDAPDANVTCNRRERSNTPMQSLTLLNDPVFFECAQVLGRRLFTEYGDDFEGALRAGFRRCVSREPTPAESIRIRDLYHGQRLLFENAPDHANSVVGSPPVGESADPDRIDEAALIMAIRTMLNLDECITRE